MTRIMLLCALIALLATACGEKKAEDAAGDEADEKAAAEEADEGEVAEAEKGEADEEEADEEEADEEEADGGEEQAAAEGDEPAEMIALKAEGGTKDAVPFPHEKHAELDEKVNPEKCTTCHHAPKGDEANPSCTTAGCHDGETEGAPSAKDAYHKLCKDGCHKKQLAADKDNEALKKVKSCSGCHAGA